MADTDFDLIVIGGGSIGLSTAWHASQRGWRTLVLERFGFFNDDGSSAGASRQYRIQYSQKYLAELAIAAQDYWSSLQQRTGETLLGSVGSVWFGDPALSSQEGGIQAAMDTMDALSVPYTKLEAEAIEQVYGFRDLPSNYSGFFQPNGAIINLKAAERAMYTAARDSGCVHLRAWTPVDGIDSGAEGRIEVASGTERFVASRLALTPGAYANAVLDPLGVSIDLDIWEMSSAYFRKEAQDVRYPTWFVFQEPQTTSLFYGFPEVDWAFPGYIRAAPDIADRILKDPAERSGVPSAKSLTLTSDWVRDHMTGLEPTPQFTSTCLIALATGKSGKELLLDYLPATVPNSQKIVTYTAGWAAKFIPILGEMVCQMLEAEVETFHFGDFAIARSNFAIDWKPAG